MGDAGAVTAQAVYADMLRSEIAPRMRSLGFTGSGPAFVLPDDDRWLIVAFQKDRYSRADGVRFTVNLTVADKATWAADRRYEPSLPVRPSGNARYVIGTATVIRLGTLMPPRGEDRWWEIGPARPSGPAARRVLNAIEAHALSWLRNRIPVGRE
jgi:uncharacterized protein DUF4304